MNRYDLKIAIRPKMDGRGRILDTDDLPALRLYQSVVNAMRRNPGMTEEQAIALYNRPRGICSDCGELCKERARRCDGCYARQAREHTRATRERQRTEKTCAFPDCTVRFVGSIGRQYCDDHTYSHGRSRAKSVNGPKKAPEPKRRIERIALPATWERPLPEAKRKLLPPEPAAIVAPPGIRTVYGPPLPGLRDLFGISGPVKTAAD